MNAKLWTFLGLLLAGTALIVGFYFLRPKLFEREQIDTSDSSHLKGTIKIGIDNWVGYFPLCGKELRKRMHADGWLVKCEDDNADYPGRMKRLRSGELQLAVATVDSYLLNSAHADYFGNVVSIIDESAGGDAIVARKSVVPNLEALKNKPNLKVAFTPSSPSDHLLKSVSSHFDVPWLREKRSRVEVNGSTEAYSQLTDGKVDVAVLWEPDVSRALADKNYVKILGTESTKRLIVDILVANRTFASDNPEAMSLLLSNYFRTLKIYRDHPDDLADEVEDVTGLKSAQVHSMLKGVRWVSLSENAREWFGIGEDRREGLIDTIESTAKILVEAGDFNSSPVPDNDPYRLQNRSFLQKAIDNNQNEMASPQDKSEISFAPLNDFQWDQLSEVGTMKIRPITFQSGTSDLSYEGKSELDAAWESLAHYPRFRVVVRGHTGSNGDREENLRLSQDRAEAVKKYLEIAHNSDSNRIRAQGFGSSRPLTRFASESDRAYEYRLPRVEIHLVSESL